MSKDRGFRPDWTSIFLIGVFVLLIVALLHRIIASEEEMGTLWTIPMICLMIPFVVKLACWPIGARIQNNSLILRYLIRSQLVIPLKEISLCCKSTLSIPSNIINEYEALILFLHNGRSIILSESMIRDVGRMPLHRFGIPYGKRISRFIPGFKWRFKPKP